MITSENLSAIMSRLRNRRSKLAATLEAEDCGEYTAEKCEAEIDRVDAILEEAPAAAERNSLLNEDLALCMEERRVRIRWMHQMVETEERQTKAFEDIARSLGVIATVVEKDATRHG